MYKVMPYFVRPTKTNKAYFQTLTANSSKYKFFEQMFSSLHFLNNFIKLSMLIPECEITQFLVLSFLKYF